MLRLLYGKIFITTSISFIKYNHNLGDEGEQIIESLWKIVLHFHNYNFEDLLVDNLDVLYIDTSGEYRFA